MNSSRNQYVINSSHKGGFESYSGKGVFDRLLITGATSAIGSSLLRNLLLTYSESRFVVSARNITKLRSIVGTLGVDQQRIEVVPLIQKPQDISKFLKAIGEIDAAIVCQGSYGVVGHFSEVDLTQLLDSFNSQMRSVLITLKALCGVERSGLRIIVLGGGGASRAYEGLVEYGMVKSSLARLVETIGLEISPRRLTINLLGPGASYSSMVDQILNAKQMGIPVDDRIVIASEGLKNNKLSISKNLVNACEFLFCADASTVTGRFISADWDLPKEVIASGFKDSFTLRRVIPI